VLPANRYSRDDIRTFTQANSNWYSIYQPRKDERLSWPSWGRAQYRGSSPARDRRSTTVQWSRGCPRIFTLKWGSHNHTGNLEVSMHSLASEAHIIRLQSRL